MKETGTSSIETKISGMSITPIVEPHLTNPTVMTLLVSQLVLTIENMFDQPTP